MGLLKLFDPKLELKKITLGDTCPPFSGLIVTSNFNKTLPTSPPFFQLTLRMLNRVMVLGET